MRKQMTTQEIRSNIMQDLSKMTKQQLANLAYHEKRKSRIACGELSGEWHVSRGG